MLTRRMLLVQSGTLAGLASLPRVALTAWHPPLAPPDGMEALLRNLLGKETPMESAAPSLLLSVLTTETDAPTPEDAQAQEALTWMAGKPERKLLMMQALYTALPYAFAHPDAARLVGSVLARSVRREPGPLPEDPAGRAAFRQEMREHLLAQYAKFREQLP